MQVACSELYPVLEDLCIDRFGAVRKAVPTPNPNLSSRWKINKSAEYTKGIPKAMGRRPIFVLVAGTFPHRHLDMPKIDTLSNSFLTVRLLTSLLRDHRTGISIRTLNLLLNFLMTSCALRALPRNPSSKQ